MGDTGKQSILLVDDNKHLLLTLGDFLSFEGFEVVSAVSAEKALQKLEKLDPDLIVLDINMPGMGGLGFLKRIQGDDGRPKYPVLVLTARAAMEEFFGTVDVEGFVAKPCVESDLLAKVKEILGHSAEEKTRPIPGRATVMIAEDDLLVRESLRRRFTSEGYTLEMVETGPEVLEKVAVVKPDVLVLKEVLPKMNGSVLVPLCKAMPSLTKMRIILYDTTREEGDDRRLIERPPEGIDRYLVTSDSVSILRAIQAVLAK